jgi:hypothetical protein
MSKKRYYYKVDLEVSLPNADYVFGYIDISHIPYSKLEELFQDQIKEEQFLFEDRSYFITENVYKKHKEYLDYEIPFKFDFSIFEYSVGLSGVEIDKYKKDYHENLPPHFDN